MNKNNLALIPITQGEIVAEPLSQEDYERLKGGFSKYRDLLLCQFLRGTGLRISEALRLGPEHFREEGMTYYVLARRGKQKGSSDLYEKVYLPPTLALSLKGFISGTGIKRGQTIFGIKRRAADLVFEKAGEKALGRSVHPHELRGLYIKTLLDGGLPVAAAAKMVGHADPKTTAKWYYELTSEQRAEIQRRIPT